ncbi:WXG100-like domain-containing protein [Nocardia macrotermitis]|uniref:Uncharacterized protein n=1 Tax=Nocardia macrotermitis TaxID=2585198 RepID=A0A7K0D965_9NOCA|nr:hypothetical protein [Nocardia macrotermitis]MQY22248.1 hypothetical protein [Nocardia macrotermitis]
MSLEMPQGLRWLSYLAGAAWPEGDEDTLFALARDWDTAATDLRNLISAVEAACDIALDNYSGSGREQMATQFGALLSGDQSVDAIAKNLQQLADSVQDCGTQIEYTKLQIISTLAIMAAEIAWALATLWGAFAVPAIEAEGAGILQIIGRALTNRLIAHAARVAEMPLWKLAAIEVLEQAGIGFVQDLAIQAYQKDEGHRSGIDWKQTLTTAAVAGISAGAATPVGHYLGAGLGNWVGRDSMTWWKSSGIAVASAVPAGLVGAGAGIVANGVITGEWEFDPAALLGGIGGGLVGGVHGVIGHATGTRLASLSLGAGDGSSPKLDGPAGSPPDRSWSATKASAYTLGESGPEGVDRTRDTDEKSVRTTASESRSSVGEWKSPQAGRSVDETASRSGGSASRSNSRVNVAPRSAHSKNLGEMIHGRATNIASRGTSATGGRNAQRANISASGGDGSSVRTSPIATARTRAQAVVPSRRIGLSGPESEPKSASPVRVPGRTAGSAESTRHAGKAGDVRRPVGAEDSRSSIGSRRAGLAAAGNDSETAGSGIESSPHPSVDRSPTSESALVQHVSTESDHRWRSPDEDAVDLNACGPLALTKIVELTGSTIARPPEYRVGRSGMSATELEDAAGAPLRSFDGHDSIGDQLLDMGPGSVALVVDAYRGPTDRYGVGAHAYLMHNEGGVIRVIDPATGQRRSRASADIRSTHAILYSDRGVPRPLPERRAGPAEHLGAVRIGTHRTEQERDLESGSGSEKDPDAELPWDIPKVVITPPEDDLPAVVREFGSRRDVAKDLSNIVPIPQETVEWLHEQIFLRVEGRDGPDEKFRENVRRVLTQRLLSSDASVWPQLMSESGMPLNVRYKGRLHPVSLRVSLRPIGPSKEQIAPLSDGPPVGIQQWAFGILSTADLSSSGDYRAFSYAYTHTFPADHGPLSYVALGGELDLVNNQVSTGITVTSTLQPMIIIRSKGRSWPFDFAMTWELSEGDSLSDALSPTPVNRIWHPTLDVPARELTSDPPSNMLVWFPNYAKVGAVPTINHRIPSTVPAPLSRAVDEFHLFGPVTIPDHVRIMSDVMTSFREHLSDMSDNSAKQFRNFFSEGNIRSLITAAARTREEPLSDDATETSSLAQDSVESSEKDESSVITPTFFTSSGKVIGALQIRVMMHGGEEITGPTTEKSVLESFVLRSQGMQGSSTTANSLGFNPSLGFGFGGKHTDPDTGIQSLGGQFTIKGGVAQKSSHILGYGGSARIAHSLRTDQPLLDVTPRMTVHVTLIPARGRPIEPAPNTPLADGADYPVKMLVPSLETLGHAPEKELYLPSEILHLRQLGVSTTPLAVQGAKPLFEDVRKWMAGLGFFPPDRDVPTWRENKAGWLWDKTTMHATDVERVDNVRKFKDMVEQLGLRGSLDEAIEGGPRTAKDHDPEQEEDEKDWDGGAITWFELPTPTGTHRISVRLITERQYLSADPNDGVSHEWTLPKVQTLNYSGSTIPGDEQFSKAPLAWNIGGNATISSPFDEKARLLFQGFTPDYTFSGQASEIRDSNSGTGHEYYTLSPTENGIQIFSVPVRHRIVMTYSHGSAPHDIRGDGRVRLAVPTYRTHTEKIHDRPAEPTFREFDDDDARRLTLPSTGRTLEDGVLRPPDTTLFDRVGGSREVRKATVDLLDDIAAEVAEEAERTSRAPESERAPHTRTLDSDPDPAHGRTEETTTDVVPAPRPPLVPPGRGDFADLRIPGSFPLDPDDIDLPVRENEQHGPLAEDAPDGPWYDIPLDDSSDDDAHGDLREPRGEETGSDRDDPADPPVPGAFPRDDGAPREGTESALTWPQVRDYLQGPLRWTTDHASDMAYSVGRWLWRNAVGEPATNPESMAHEAIHTSLSPYHMVGDALRIFRDSYMAVEGASTPGWLAGTNISVKVTGYLTNVKVHPQPPKMDAERWLQSVSGAGHTKGRQRTHRTGATLTESVGKVDRNVIPGAGYHYSTTTSHSDTVNDTTGVFRVTTEDTTPVHWFTADAHYIVHVRVGARNLAFNVLGGKPRVDRTRVVDVPDAVEFLLVDNDLQNNPDLLELVDNTNLENLEAGTAGEYGKITEADPPDRGLPIAYVEGKRIGYGAVTNVDLEGGREALQNLALELMEEYAPGSTEEESSNYVAGVKTRINEHTTTLGLRTLPNAGPDGRTAFHIVDRSNPFDPHLVTVTFAAGPDPAVDLSAIRGKQVTETSGVDNIFGHQNGDGAALEVPGATRMTDSRQRGHQIDVSISGQHNGHRPKFDVAVQRQSNVTEIQTSSRERRAWERSFGKTSEFSVPHVYGVRLTRHPLDEARLAYLVRRGIAVVAHAGGPGLVLLPPLDISELAAPTSESHRSLRAGTLMRFNTSETPDADTVVALPEPALYRSDPLIRPEASHEGDSVIEMEVSPGVRDLLTGPTWVPTRGIEIYQFDGVPELAQALRHVDPSVDVDDRMLTNRSSEGMFIRLTTLVESNRLTLVGPAATAPFLNTRSQPEPLPPGPPARDGDHIGPTSVKITLYSPEIEKSSKDIAIDDIWWASDGFETEADNSINTTMNFSLSSPYTGEANDRGAFTIPLAGEHAELGQYSVVTSNRRELLRFGTPMEGAAKEPGGETVGTIGHRVRALALIEVRGPEGTLWVSGGTLLRTTETPPGARESSRTDTTDLTKPETTGKEPEAEFEHDAAETDPKTRAEARARARERAKARTRAGLALAEAMSPRRTRTGTEADSAPKTGSDADARARAEAAAEAKAKSEAEVRARAEAEAKSKSDAEAAKRDAAAKAEAEARARAETGARTESGARRAARVEAEAQDRARAEAVAGIRAKAEAAEAKSEAAGTSTDSGAHHRPPVPGGLRPRGPRFATVGRIPAPAGHVWESMPGDGDCFFYGLERVVYRDDPPATGEELDRRIRRLRAEVADELVRDPDTHFGNFHAVLTDTGRARGMTDSQLWTAFYRQAEAITNRGVWRNAVSHTVPQAAAAVLARHHDLTLRVQSRQLRAGWTFGENTRSVPDATTLVYGSHYYLAVPTGQPAHGSGPSVTAPLGQRRDQHPAESTDDVERSRALAHEPDGLPPIARRAPVTPEESRDDTVVDLPFSLSPGRTTSETVEHTPVAEPEPEPIVRQHVREEDEITASRLAGTRPRQRLFPLVPSAAFPNPDPRLFTVSLGKPPDLTTELAEPQVHDSKEPTISTSDTNPATHSRTEIRTGGTPSGTDREPMGAKGRPPRTDGTTGTDRATRTDGTTRTDTTTATTRTDSTLRMDDPVVPAAAQRVGTRRLHRFVSHLRGRGASGSDTVEPRPAVGAPHRHLRDIFRHPLSRFRSRTTSSTTATTRGDGATARTTAGNPAQPATGQRAHPDSLADALAGIQRDTGSTAKSARLRDDAVPQFPRNTRIGVSPDPRTVIGTMAAPPFSAPDWTGDRHDSPSRQQPLS